MIWALSALSCAAFLMIIGLALGAARLGWGRYWPPESPERWQHSSFRVLFRLGLYPLITASAILARENGMWSPVFGLPLLILGLTAALLFTTKLGWKQAFGSAERLVTTGPYAYSRNPVYVATWVALTGWALCLPDPAVLAPLFLWALLYLIAPFLEEPWLDAQFGESFQAYKARVPRFLFF